MDALYKLAKPRIKHSDADKHLKDALTPSRRNLMLQNSVKPTSLNGGVYLCKGKLVYYFIGKM